MNIPFFKEIASGNRILIAGAGGGFDVTSGIPLFLYLKSLGKEVILANLSFSDLYKSGCDLVAPGTYLIDENAVESDYFPEKFIRDWLITRGLETPIYGFSKKLGVEQLQVGYETIITKHGIDTVILVDGGTDSLIFGDEPGIGTIVEDACSMVACSEIPVRSYLVAIGFGIDHFHDVNHHACLENIATLIKDKGYLGAFSLTEQMVEGAEFLELVSYLNEKNSSQKSIVINSIAGAIRGDFGDVHATDRTLGMELFINPLMGFYWTFSLKAVVGRMVFAERIKKTRSMHEIA